MIKLPNFLIVGAAKCATTSLYYYLKEHPEIFLPKVKETNFFVEPKEILGCGPRYCGKDSVGKNFRVYSELYKDVDPMQHKAVGEICVTYLYFYKNAIPNIIRYLGNPKIIIILRNPVDRAYSHYMHNLRDGDEKYSFEQALELEDERIKQNLWCSFHLKSMGYYYNQVKSYKEHFTNVKILLYEDMKKDMHKFLKEIFEFLQVQNIKLDTSRKYNISGIPRIKILHKAVHSNFLLKKLVARSLKVFLSSEKIDSLKNYIVNKNLQKIKMDEQTRLHLNKLYIEDIKKLSKLINKDLIEIWNIEI